MKSLILILLYTTSAISADDDFIQISELHSQGIIPMINNGTVSEHIAYMASLRFRFDESSMFGLGHYCGGVFITRKHVLTLATCVGRELTINTAMINIVGGTRYRYDDTEAIVSSVMTIIRHPDFSLDRIPNNIAVIVLSEEISPDIARIYPITISETSAQPSQAFQIFGWGAPRVSNGTAELLTGRIVTVERDTCPQTFVNRFCAGPVYLGGCAGDDGGAVVTNRILYGLVDYRLSSYCEEMQPAHLYVDVVAHRAWIQSTINSSTKQLVSANLVVLTAFSTWVLSSQDG